MKKWLRKYFSPNSHRRLKKFCPPMFGPNCRKSKAVRPQSTRNVAKFINWWWQCPTKLWIKCRNQKNSHHYQRMWEIKQKLII